MMRTQAITQPVQAVMYQAVADVKTVPEMMQALLEILPEILLATQTEITS
jgi:hypothetical protein